MTNPEEVKEKFYDDLNTLIKSTPRHDKLTLLGDFNARVGKDYTTWSNVIRKNGVGKCNSNGLLLLQFCAKHGLLITNTLSPAHSQQDIMDASPIQALAFVIARR